MLEQLRGNRWFRLMVDGQRVCEVDMDSEVRVIEKKRIKTIDPKCGRGRWTRVTWCMQIFKWMVEIRQEMFSKKYF